MTTFGLKISSTAIALITNVLLARLLGKAGLGTYVYSLTWVSLLTIPATLGFRQLVVREVAICRAKSLWGEFHGLIKWANFLILTFSTSIAIIAFLISRFTTTESDSLVPTALAIALCLLPIESLTIVRASIMQGLEFIIRSQLPELLIAPLLALIFIGFAYFYAGYNLPVNYALLSRVVAFYIAFYVGSKWLKNSLPVHVRKVKPEYQVRKWMSSAIPFMCLEGIRVIHHQTDILMLGTMQGPEAVGIYSVISRGVMLVVFVLGAVNTAISPTIAKLYTLGDTNKLQRIIAKSSRLVFIVSLLFTLLFIIFGHWFLLLFGEDFLDGRTALNILCIGKMVGALTTSSAFLLTMTGHERHIVISSSVSSGLNLVLNLLFIPRWGIEGAAIATTLSSVFLHFWNGLSVWKTTRINPTPFNFKT